MESTFRPSVPETVKSAGRDAQRLGQEVKNDVAEVVSRGRDMARDFAAEASKAADDLSQQRRAVAEKTRGYLREGRDRVSKASDRVSVYADENTAIVAAAAFGAGLLLGYLATRRTR